MAQSSLASSPAVPPPYDSPVTPVGRLALVLAQEGQQPGLHSPCYVQWCQQHGHDGIPRCPDGCNHRTDQCAYRLVQRFEKLRVRFGQMPVSDDDNAAGTDNDL